MEWVHLDTAAAGRSSAATLRAAAVYAEREALVGAYVAEAEAAPLLERGRAELAALLGVPAGGLAFVESGSAARAAILGAWPLLEGDTVAVVRSEWGPNLSAFDGCGLRVVELAEDGDGVVDLGILERFLTDAPPAFVHLTQVASHRGLVQPVAAAAALCRAAGVPLWVDACQALGHVDTAVGADVSYSTSRKWLAGPRGVGLLAVAERWWGRLRVSASPMDLGGLPAGYTPVRVLESHEANFAGRIGLCAAVRQHLDADPVAVRKRLAEVGRMTREILGDVPGWAVVDPVDAPSAISALRPLEGQDVTETRLRLIAEHGIVTTAAQPARAPLEMTESLLRVSPHVDGTPEELSLLADALSEG